MSIPSFLDILLDSEFRVQHKPPPLQVHETQEDRDYVDHFLPQFWDLKVSRSFLNKHKEDTGKEFTYGEITSTGVRQLLEDMELLTLFSDDDANDDGKDTSNHDDDDDDDEVVFYDLGSGEGKLAVQLFLEMNFQKIVGIELSPARHEMAVHSWNKLQEYLLAIMEGDNKQDVGETTLGGNDGTESTCKDSLLGEEGDTANEADQNINISNNNRDTPMEPRKLVAAKERLRKKLLANASTTTCSNNGINTQCVQLVHGDLLDYDFSDATHIYAASIFFPPAMLESMSQKIMDYSQAKGKIKMVAALSDLELLEAEDAGWEKRVQRLQMSWGGANVRLYSPKDY